MKHIFVTNNTYGTTVSTLDDVNALAAGSLAIFNQATGVLHPATGGDPVVATTELDPMGVYQFVIGYDGVNVKPDINLIEWGNVIEISKREYSAPVAKIMAFGDSVVPVSFGTIVANSTYTIVVENKNKSIHDTTRKRYYTVVSTATDTAATLLGKLVSKINIDPLRIVTASIHNTDDGIKFVGEIGINYGIQVLDDLVSVGYIIESAASDNKAAYINGIYYSASTPITLTAKYGAATLDATLLYAKYFEGVGTYAKVLAIEQELSSHKGDTKSSYKTELFYNAPTNTNPTATYTIYDIIHNGGTANYPMQAESFVKHLIIAVDDKQTALISDLDIRFGLA
jgi:hypothetical protein